MQAQSIEEFQSLRPESIQQMTRIDIEDRTNELSRIVFMLFKNRRTELMRIPDLTANFEDAESKHSLRPTIETERVMLETSKAMSRSHSMVRMAKKNIDAINNELGYINHFHSTAYQFTQVLLDAIEIGQTTPRSPRWQ
jgi:hypothetical protein